MTATNSSRSSDPFQIPSPGELDAWAAAHPETLEAGCKLLRSVYAELLRKDSKNPTWAAIEEVFDHIHCSRMNRVQTNPSLSSPTSLQDGPDFCRLETGDDKHISSMLVIAYLVSVPKAISQLTDLPPMQWERSTGADLTQSHEEPVQDDWDSFFNNLKDAGEMAQFRHGALWSAWLSWAWTNREYLRRKAAENVTFKAMLTSEIAHDYHISRGIVRIWAKKAGVRPCLSREKFCPDDVKRILEFGSTVKGSAGKIVAKKLRKAPI